MIQRLTSAALLVAGGLLAGAGWVSVGVVVTFVLASRDLFSSVDDFTLVAGEMLESRVGLARLLDLLDVAEPPARRSVRDREEPVGPQDAGLVAERSRRSVATSALSRLYGSGRGSMAVGSVEW
ncbi:hypothetical protein [Dactylosporangium sp. NPDC049140]|uniref:hypothetical protein n=1 Tax=Dactylosporangium sp. NPDC049140 TaxID=3155647 RepID=UPI0033E9CC16